MASDPTSRPKRDVVVAAVAIATFHMGLFLPFLLSGDLLFPVSPRSAPPWMDAARPVTSPQDREGTDKIVFNYPNIVRWVREAPTDPRALLWNPDNWCGISFLATQNTHVLYPLNVVFLAFGPERGLLISALLHGWIASFLAWIVLVRVCGPAGALAGALVFGGSGWFLAHHDLMQYVQAAAWVPLMILGADRLVMGRRVLGGVALAGGLALSFFGGMPQITIIGLLAAGLCALARAEWLRRRAGGVASVAGLGRAVLGVVLGCLLAAPQLLPTLEISGDSGRREIPLEDLRARSARPVEAVELVVPGVLGYSPVIDALRLDPTWTEDERRLFSTDVARAGFVPARVAGLLRNGDSFIERVCAPGLVGGLLLLLACLRPRDGRTLLGLVLCAVGVLGVLGTPVLDALYALPGFAFANHRRLIFLVVIGSSLLVAVGMEGLVKGSGLLAARRLALLAALVLGGGWIALRAWPSLAESLWGVASDDPQAPFLAPWTRAHLWPPAFAAIAAATALTFAIRSRRGLLSLPSILLVTLLLELALYNARWSPGQPAGDAFPATPIIEWLQERRGDLAHAPARDGSGLHRIIRYKNPATDFPGTSADLPPLPPNLNLLFEIQDVQGYEAITDRHVEELLGILEPNIALHHHLLQELRRPESLASPILDLLGVRYVLSPAATLPGLERAPLPEAWMTQERMAVHVRQGPMPRFQTPSRIHVVDDEGAVLAWLARPAFDPREEAVLLREDARGLRLVDGYRRGGASPRIEVVSYAPTRVVLRYETSEQTPLLMADTFHPGWTAEVSAGAELPVVRADHALRMVMLPEGEGTLTFSFWPSTLTLGLASAGAGVLVLLLWGAVRRRDPLMT